MQLARVLNTFIACYSSGLIPPDLSLVGMKRRLIAPMNRWILGNNNNTVSAFSAFTTPVSLTDILV